MTLPLLLPLAATALQLHLGAQCIQTDISSIDSLTFDAAQQQLVVYRAETSGYYVPISSIDSISFPQLQSYVSIRFGADIVSSVNPYYFDGLTIECSGNNVKVVSHCDFVTDIIIEGQASDASILIEADQPIRLHLNGLELSSSRPSIIKLAKASAATILIEGENTLRHTASEFDRDSPEAAIFAAGQLTLSGSGALTVLTEGKVGHSLHAGSLSIEGGSFTIDNCSRGIKDIGVIYSPIAILADETFEMSRGRLSIHATREACKGIVCQGPVTIGPYQDTSLELDIHCIGKTLYTPGSDGHTLTEGCPAILTTRSISIRGGIINIETADNASQGCKAGERIDISGGQLFMQCYDDCLNSAGPITLAGGTTVCYSTGDDAIDSDYAQPGAIVIEGGNLFAYTTQGPSEEALDCDDNSRILLRSGIVVTFGGAQHPELRNLGSNQQPYYLGPALDDCHSGCYYSLTDPQGNPICSFRFDHDFQSMQSLFSSPGFDPENWSIVESSEPPSCFSESVAGRFFLY
ncbi:MAG: carbohydrate-binding domain-containing protein [Bacteroidales bacterium]|nr:carbohydrate-binding domain-containing protein [Bacteroidales bacterium]